MVLGLGLLPLVGCENNLVEPLATGTEIPFLTPSAQFYIQYGGQVMSSAWGGVQQIARDDWQLSIDGLVDTPLTIRFADLQAEVGQAVTVLNTMRCITDDTTVPGLIGTALWTGIPLRVFLDRAGVDLDRARRLHIFASDGFTNNLSLGRIYGPQPDDDIEPLLVYEMNGQPLTAEHGFPVRLLNHTLYGYNNVKWIERIEAVESDAVFGTYQEVLEFIDQGVIRIVNKVTNPLRNQTISAGPFKIFGYALSGFAGVAQVEISIDDAPFEAARIVPLPEILATNPLLRTALQLENPEQFSYPFRGVWALWEFAWMAPPGRHMLRVRASDAAGHVQPGTDLNAQDGFNPVFEVLVDVA